MAFQQPSASEFLLVRRRKGTADQVDPDMLLSGWQVTRIKREVLIF
jgi:hypothetical protein